MECQIIQDLILKDKSLRSEKDSELLEAHLRICPSCRAFQYLTEMENTVFADPVPVPALPPDFIAKTMQKLPADYYPLNKQNTKKSNVAVMKPDRRFVWKHMGIAASLFLFLGTGFYFHDDLGRFFFGNPTENSVMIAQTQADAPAPAVSESSDTVSSESDKAEEAAIVAEVPSPEFEEATIITEDAAQESKNDSSQPQEVAAPQSKQYAPAPETYAPPVKQEAYNYDISYGATLASSVVNSPVQSVYETADFTQIVKSSSDTEQPPNIVLSPIPATYSLVNFEQQSNSYSFEYTDDTHPERQIIFTAELYNSPAVSDAASSVQSDTQNSSTRLIESGDLIYQITISCTDNNENLDAILDRIAVEPR